MREGGEMRGRRDESTSREMREGDETRGARRRGETRDR